MFHSSSSAAPPRALTHSTTSRLSTGAIAALLLAAIACVFALLAASAAPAPALAAQADDAAQAPAAPAAPAAQAAKKVTLYSDSATQAKKKLAASGLKAAKAKWKSSKPKVAMVKAGKVTAKKPGKAIITAKQGKKTFKFMITVKKVSINKKSVSIAKGKTIKLSLIGDKIKAAKSSATKIATVTKAGKVKAKKAGEATITLTSKKGKKYKCKVTVPAPKTVAVKSASFAKKTLALTRGDAGTSNPATVSPSNATNKKVTYSSSNTSVATVSSTGVVTPVSVGKATITAKSANGKKATCTVTVSPRTATAKTGAELRDLLESGEIFDKVMLSTQESGTIQIQSDADLTGTELVVDAPNATVENYVAFKSITIENIASDTYREFSLNSIFLKAQSSHLIVEKGASVKVNIESNVKNANVEMNGIISELHVRTLGNVYLSGTNTNSFLDTNVYSAATISTSIPLNIRATAQATFILHPGSEGTSAVVNDATCIPLINGIGSVEARVANSSGAITDVSTVVANYDQSVADSDAVATIAETTGRVIDGSIVANTSGQAADANAGDKDDGGEAGDPDPEDIAEANAAAAASNATPIADATVQLYRHGQESGSALGTATTDSDGNFTFTNLKAGNYVLHVTKSGYDEAILYSAIENVDGNYQWGDIPLFPAGESQDAGSMSGLVIDATQQGNVGIEDITLRLREGSGNVTGDVVATTTSSADGSYAFGDLPAGPYTVQAIDMRNGSTRYLTTSANVNIKSGIDNNKVIGMTPGVDRGKLQFVLHWNDEKSGAPADLDSHLYGPLSGEAGLFHTYYSDMSYYRDGVEIVNLDRDDVTWEGPETTTVSELSRGVYTFFVHDYTNLSASESTALGNSGAYVEVYSGTGAPQVFKVPAGQPGTVWAVCSYDSNTGAISPLNWMGYESSSSGVGDSLLYNGLAVTGAQESSFVNSCEVSGGQITLDVRADYQGDFRTNMEAVKLIVSEGGTASVYYDEDYDAYFAKAVSADGTTTRRYSVNYNWDWGDLRISDFEKNEVVETATIGEDYVVLYVSSMAYADFKDYVKPIFETSGISYELTETIDDEGWSYVELTITNGTTTRTYEVNVSQAFGDLRITDIQLNDQIVDFSVPSDSSSDTINITCVNTDFSTWSSQLIPTIAQAGATYKVMLDDYDEPYIYITYGNNTRRYWINVTEDPFGGLAITSIETNDVIREASIDEDYVDLLVSDDSFSVYQPKLKPTVAPAGATCQVLLDEYDEPYIEIAYGGNTRTYTLYVSKDWEGLELAGIQVNDVVTSNTYDREEDSTNPTLYATDTTWGALKANIKPIFDDANITYTLTPPYEDADDADELSYSTIELTISRGGSSRVYELYIRRDWQGFELSAVEKNDVVKDFTIDYDHVSLCVTDTDPDVWLSQLKPIVEASGVTATVVSDEESVQIELSDASGKFRAYTVDAYDESDYYYYYGSE